MTFDRVWLVALTLVVVLLVVAHSSLANHMLSFAEAVGGFIHSQTELNSATVKTLETLAGQR